MFSQRMGDRGLAPKGSNYEATFGTAFCGRTITSRALTPFDMPSGCVASHMNLANEVQRTDTEIQRSLTAVNAALLFPTARVANEESAVSQGVDDFRRLEISGSQVLIGFLFGLCLVWLFVAGIVRFCFFSR